MFRYKDNWIVPQREHARLAGFILDNFKISYFGTIPKDVVLEATIFHQQGYPEFDHIDFRSPKADRDLNVYINDTNEDILISQDALTLVMIHNLRILRETKIPADNWEGYISLANKLEEKINNRISKSNFEYPDFWEASHNLRLADRISFLLSEGKEGSTEFSINNIRYTFSIKENLISINPWIFKSNDFNLYLMAYESREYGKVNKPSIITFNFLNLETV